MLLHSFLKQSRTLEGKHKLAAWFQLGIFQMSYSRLGGFEKRSHLVVDWGHCHVLEGQELQNSGLSFEESNFLRRHVGGVGLLGAYCGVGVLLLFCRSQIIGDF